MYQGVVLFSIFRTILYACMNNETRGFPPFRTSKSLSSSSAVCSKLYFVFCKLHHHPSIHPSCGDTEQTTTNLSSFLLSQVVHGLQAAERVNRERQERRANM